MRKNEYVYIVVRKDLHPKSYIAVQAGHAAMESGIYFGKKTAEPYYFCMLEVQNENKLKQVMSDLNLTDISYRAFIEPDIGHEFTALATEPISKEKGSFFKRFKLLDLG